VLLHLSVYHIFKSKLIFTNHSLSTAKGSKITGDARSQLLAHTSSTCYSLAASAAAQATRVMNEVSLLGKHEGDEVAKVQRLR
jgi:hypothetical protein